MFEQKYENSKINSPENCHFTAVKNRCILHGRVFVMRVESVVVNTSRFFVDELIRNLFQCTVALIFKIYS